MSFYLETQKSSESKDKKTKFKVKEFGKSKQPQQEWL